MDILRASAGWARAELLSNGVFVLFGILFLMASLGLWHIGKTETARAFVIPALVAGVLLLILGGGLLLGTWKSLAGFDAAHTRDAPAFVASEIARVDRTMAQYAVAAFKGMPLLILACAALIVILQGPVWRASLITAIALLVVVMAVDSTAHARLAAFKERLLAAKVTPRAPG
ncbi:hypothetical protein [Vannielia litorea]|uniref:Uncharacterized protein n=1 Tax=Vannielia litorea TaxID=1217970 RepID=A0A1N6FY47_9RHOB|nr:hypothetical protein [Vannielia litorea]SIO00198.1 hypothetical protein SAMN05444002_2055 [Vannielia litorea]